jgi:hypothetical protein
VWTESRASNDDRIHIYLPDERYLVVLADRGDYILPWTAFYIEHENGHRKYLQRYARTPKNAEAALVDGLVTPSTTWWMRCPKLIMAGCDVNNLFFS